MLKRGPSRSGPADPSTRRLEGLPARGPARDLRRKPPLFGQLIGSRDILAPRFRSSPSGGPSQAGEVHFNWILGGRAIQGVWGPTDPRTKRLIPVGTTIRYFDPVINAWRSTWLSPTQRDVRRFIGRPVRSEIVLQEENRGLRTERWVFADIRPDSFRWYAMKRRRRGGPWRKFEETKRRRRTGTESSSR